MYAAIKINSQQEYKEGENLLIEKGFKSDEGWNKWMCDDMINDNSQHYVVIYTDKEFLIHTFPDNAKVFENINEFLKEV